MVASVLPSTFLLTLLLSVGLFFFIRASVKERTQVIKLVSEQTEDSVLLQLQQYFAQRAYRIKTTDAEQCEIVLEGFVRPSLFLAIFLTLLAAIGILCLSLVLAISLPQFSVVWFGLVLLSPLAGIFYWSRAGRSEEVSLQIESTLDASQEKQSLVTIVAHRDELAALQRSFAWKQVES